MPSAHPMRIVYIEDNEANRTLVRKVLEVDPAIEVTGLTSAEDGLDVLRRDTPDVLLVDIDLPGMSGLDLVRALRKEARFVSLPIIAISASVMKDERHKALEAGCDAFVEKPFDIQRLRDLVAEVSSARPDSGPPTQDSAPSADG